MNEHKKVEHPITELTAGIDLAHGRSHCGGEKFPFSPNDFHWHGHAIECACIFEDPANGFLQAQAVSPQFIEPHGPGIRVDSGFSAR
ncbi:MAG: hypothetical protein IPJ46_07695 [Anaerolineales bacterium]|nr:hypothetical protein [Anaerolineales bacterium]